MSLSIRIFLSISFFAFAAATSAAENPYAWLSVYDAENAIENRIAPPQGFTRVPAPEASFAAWLRGLPLKPGLPPVHLYNGEKKRRQDVHVAVVDMDVGKRDLQQCADAVMRLRAEYLYALGRYADIHFNFTSGDRASYTKYAEGYRARIKGNRVAWVKSAAPSHAYATFRKYLDLVFCYAGTLSLSRELKPVNDLKAMQIGDVFIQGGAPGHAVMVVDRVESEAGERLFLLAQSYMPAQEIHLLKNFSDSTLSPWYRCDFEQALLTPEWRFKKADLMRFSDAAE